MRPLHVSFCLLFLIAMTAAAKADVSASAQPAATSSPAAAGSQSSGVAFDEIRWRAVDTRPLPPGSFAADREQLMKRAVPAERYPDVDGNVLGNLGAAPMSMQPQFVAIYRYSYLGDWVRVDDLLAQTAAISRPDLAQTIFLNLAAKTYRTTQSPAQPAPMPSPSASPTEQRVASNYKFEITSSAAPDMSLDGLQATGLVLDGTLTTVNATQTCIEMQGSMHWLLYQSIDVQNPSAAPINLSAPLSIFKCTFDMQRSVVTRPPANLVLYLSVTLSMSAGPIQIKPIVSVIERGNVVKLSQADAALFNIPQDFLPQGKVSSLLWSKQ